VGVARWLAGRPGMSGPLGVVASLAVALSIAACGASAPADRAATADSAATTGSPPGVGSSAVPSRAASASRSAAGTRHVVGRARTARSAPRFWSGTDGFEMPVTGTGPYAEPVIGGTYGGYVGMAGNWAHWQGCGGGLVWSGANARQAAVNLARYRAGIGVAVFWFMAGPGVDPRYDGTVAEAVEWGRRQAARALANMGGAATYPVLWMDVELPGDAPQFTPAPDNGWQVVYTSTCSGRVRTRHIDPAVDRGVVDGFASYLTAHSSYKPGVYSAPAVWKAIFGTGGASRIPGLYEWTYAGNTSSLEHLPSGWCLKDTSTCARFFGGQHRGDRTALMWQWSGGGGTRNGYGDFDQIDGARTP
jgi:hypothetical protein